ncbi:hypothetical protein AVEN_63178-1 [Araneus ventricosus]|uniref:MATH domain-containing protein n=1 Tax=Araneus ventricosus TaxID=182803 RepID=A0A4Y2B1G4_ARAVE|nr:hypothetical protein AVEN_63178-1 [Araneus ventricosus]
MAEGNLKGVVTRDEQVSDGHKIIYKFKVYRLDFIERTFHPLEYNTQCRTIPTSWKMELKCERVSEVYDSYTFSIKLKRKDSSNHRVKASLYVSFYDVDGTPALYPISSSKDRMVHDDELHGTFYNILPSVLSKLVAVEVAIAVKKCHTGTWQCASKVNTDKNSINLSRL